MSCMTSPTDTPALEDLRTECRLAWFDGQPADPPLVKFVSGPLRGFHAPLPTEGTIWQGAWFDDVGQQVLVTYEINDEGVAEYSGSKTMADIATDTTNAEFDKLREHDEPDVDLEALPAAEARDFLALDNERRVKELLEASGGQADLTNAFDILEIQIMLRHLLHAAGEKVELESELEFGNEVSLKLDDIEDKYTQFAKAREVAERQAMLSGGPPAPIHNGRVTLPARRIRRTQRG